MSQHIKTDHLRYFHKGFLSKKWKEYFFVLFDDSTLQWFEKQSDYKAEGGIRIYDVAQYLCVGVYTRALPNRPELPQPTDEANLIAIPRLPIGHRDQEIVWILCDNVTHLNDWMKAIVSTLPPPPQPQGINVQPSAPPPPDAFPPYPPSNPYPPPPPPPYQQQPLYPPLPGNQPQYRPAYAQPPVYQNANAYPQPAPVYRGGNAPQRRGLGGKLAAGGLGFAAGGLFGGALGYVLGEGSERNDGWSFGSGTLGNVANLGNLGNIGNMANLGDVANFGNVGNLGNLGNAANLGNLGGFNFGHDCNNQQPQDNNQGEGNYGGGEYGGGSQFGGGDW